LWCLVVVSLQKKSDDKKNERKGKSDIYAFNIFFFYDDKETKTKKTKNKK
tara:strand:- start:192 stop:341 length:150 start_codon:yes stop_codon:yes gene_type:complete